MAQGRVHLVVDRAFGEKAWELPLGDPAWMVDTPANAPIIARIREYRADPDHLTGVTSFRDSPEWSVEDLAAAHLSTIELHHGEYSSDVPFVDLHIIGAQATSALLAAAAKLGFTEFRGQDYDFELHRPDSPDAMR